MMSRFGRFTVYGGPALEQELTILAAEAAAVVRAGVRSGAMEALVLLGGYGRGEGGVQVRDGREAPHNNFDFLLLTRGLGKAASKDLKRDLAPRLTALGAPLGIGMDLSVMPASALRRAPALVLWYDMRFGHKTLAGNEGFVPSLSQMTLDRVPATDVLRLMVNRGTLFLLNDLITAFGDPTGEHRRTLLKHTVKGIIGYGDAFLFSRGRYHWSYRARRSAMAALAGEAGGLAEMYDRALEFRFRPDYARFEATDLGRWTGDILPELERAHLDFERWRLDRPGLTWDTHIDAGFRRVAGEGLRGPRALARSLRNASRSDAFPAPCTRAAALGYRVGGLRSVLDMVFPTLAYRFRGNASLELARRLLDAPDPSRLSLVEAYLRHWGVHGDDNLQAVLDSLNLNRRPREAARRSAS